MRQAKWNGAHIPNHNKPYPYRDVFFYARPFGVTQLGTHVRIVSLNKLDPITTSNNVTLNRTRLEFAVKVDTVRVSLENHHLQFHQS